MTTLKDDLKSLDLDTMIDRIVNATFKEPGRNNFLNYFAGLPGENLENNQLWQLISYIDSLCFNGALTIMNDKVLDLFVDPFKVSEGDPDNEFLVLARTGLIQLTRARAGMWLFGGFDKAEYKKALVMPMKAQFQTVAHEMIHVYMPLYWTDSPR